MKVDKRLNLGSVILPDARQAIRFIGLENAKKAGLSVS